jgi:hypothetical protein
MQNNTPLAYASAHRKFRRTNTQRQLHRMQQARDRAKRTAHQKNKHNPMGPHWSHLRGPSAVPNGLHWGSTLVPPSCSEGICKASPMQLKRFRGPNSDKTFSMSLPPRFQCCPQWAPVGSLFRRLASSAHTRLWGMLTKRAYECLSFLLVSASDVRLATCSCNLLRGLGSAKTGMQVISTRKAQD